MWTEDSFAQREVESGSANGLKLPLATDSPPHGRGEGGRISSIQIQETQGINTIRGNTGTTFEEIKTYREHWNIFHDGLLKLINFKPLLGH